MYCQRHSPCLRLHPGLHQCWKGCASRRFWHWIGGARGEAVQHSTAHKRICFQKLFFMNTWLSQSAICLVAMFPVRVQCKMKHPAKLTLNDPTLDICTAENAEKCPNSNNALEPKPQTGPDSAMSQLTTSAWRLSSIQLWVAQLHGGCQSPRFCKQQ